MDQVLRIENECFESPYDMDWFLSMLRQRNVIGMVAEARGDIASFMLYELHGECIDLLDFAVATRYQRQGIGSVMMHVLIDKLSHQRRKAVEVIISDRNDVAHVFFRSCGFRAVSVLRDHFEADDGEFMDGYLFQYRI